MKISPRKSKKLLMASFWASYFALFGAPLTMIFLGAIGYNLWWAGLWLIPPVTLYLWWMIVG